MVNDTLSGTTQCGDFVLGWQIGKKFIRIRFSPKESHHRGQWAGVEMYRVTPADKRVLDEDLTRLTNIAWTSEIQKAAMSRTTLADELLIGKAAETPWVIAGNSAGHFTAIASASGDIVSLTGRNLLSGHSGAFSKADVELLANQPTTGPELAQMLGFADVADRFFDSF